MRRLVLILAATYPDGSLGSVVALKPLGDFEGDPFAPPLGHPLLDEAVADITALYHTTIGPAYAPEDFAYTFYDVPGDEALFDLVGPHWLATEGIISNIQRPLAIGPNLP